MTRDEMIWDVYFENIKRATMARDVIDAHEIFKASARVVDEFIEIASGVQSTDRGTV